MPQHWSIARVDGSSERLWQPGSFTLQVGSAPFLQQFFNSFASAAHNAMVDSGHGPHIGDIALSAELILKLHSLTRIRKIRAANRGIEATR